LFSKQGTREFRKSVIILLTPRRTHYVNQSSQAQTQREAKLSDFERTVQAFEQRNQNWFVPRSTISDAMAVATSNNLFQEFKTGDFQLESWHTRDTHTKRLKNAVDFIFY
jgi:general secretion pathway protein D